MTKKSGRKTKGTSTTRAWEPVVGALIAIALVAGIFLITDRKDTPPPPKTPRGAEQATASLPPAIRTFSPAEIERTRRIDASEAKRLLDSGRGVAVDVRDVQSYVGGHIPGALHIPLQYIPGEIQWFPRDKTIIPYCT